MHDDDFFESRLPELPSRRAIMATAAFAVPAIAMVVTTPAVAATGQRHITTTLNPSTVISGGTSTVTATVTDSAENVLAGQSISLSGSRVSFAQANGTTDGSGQYSTTVTANGSGGTTSTVTASSPGSGGTVSASASLTVVSRKISVALSPSSLAPGASATVTATVQDSADNPLSNQSVTLSATNGVTLGATSGTTNSSGQFVTTAQTASSSGSSTITVTSTGGDGTVSASATLTFTDGLVLMISPSSWGRGTTPITATATYTANGSPVASQPLRLDSQVSNTGGGSGSVTWSGVTTKSTNSQGEATFSGSVRQNWVVTNGAKSVYTFTITAANSNTSTTVVITITP